MKFFSWISNNILFVTTLFLLAFIPLYPKLPLVGVEHTWVYIRLEDFFLALSVALLFLQVIRKKVTLKTPLTIPILTFWIVGLISTVYAIFFIFPTIANVFPNVAVFSYLRRIEYLSVFFIAYSAIKNVKDSKIVAIALSIILLLVVGYGAGQRLDPGHFLAYSTMNEEFAKGIPLRLSALGRVQSTFAGHYDLAAYLVMLIPIIGSMAFGFRSWFARIYFPLVAALGLICLLLTASRVSFAVYLVSIIFMLVMQNQKKFIIPVIIASIIILQFFQGVTTRFSNTISQVDLVVDARTGKAIGIAKPQEPGTGKKNVVIDDVQSTGENLPQGSGYITLPSNPIKTDVNQITYTKNLVRAGTESAQVTDIKGNFVIKRVLAYDVSFTTRFQGEWPRAIEAFKRNILLGSGYSSISLATDNNYLRILGEVGALGLASFVLIFLISAILLKHALPRIESKTARSLVLGIIAGLFGLSLNAILIDVFEASKVAFVMWMLIGIGIALLHLHQKTKINYKEELRKMLLSTPFLLIYLLIFTISIFSIIVDNYFVGDDFTWLHWAADCHKIFRPDGTSYCDTMKNTLFNYFIHSEGFFYRPLAKVYYYFTYALFGLNPFAYHVMSMLLHFGVTAYVFVLSKKFLKSSLYGFIAAILFLVLSAHSEVIFWVAATGFLFVSLFCLSALWFYIRFKETGNWVYVVVSILLAFMAPFFHELGIVAALFILLNDLITTPKEVLKLRLKTIVPYLLYAFTIILYYAMRKSSESLWFNGDYSYNLEKLPYNIFGNIAGYISLVLFGTSSIKYYDAIRIYGKTHLLEISVVILLCFVVIGVLWIKKMRLKKENITVLSLAATFFVIGLLPFLGLGNIAVRYVYLASFGLLLFLTGITKMIADQFSHASRVIVTAVVVFLVILLAEYHIAQLHRINKDWEKAGSISNNMLLIFNYAFSSKVKGTNPVFYFVNVPIRLGEAWVFPVGIPDALWFAFQDANLTVKMPKTLDEALKSAEGSASAKVFQFTPDGNIEEFIPMIPSPTPTVTKVKKNGK